MENTINTVNIELSKYNDLNNKLNEKTAQLAQTISDANALRYQVNELKSKDNKIVIVEKKSFDPYRGHSGIESTIKYDISNPDVSNEILKIISKIDNVELSDKIKSLEATLKEKQESFDNLMKECELSQRDYQFNTRKIEQDKKEEILKLRKQHESAIQELNESIDKLTKDLKDLKVNKTQEQLELARQEEITILKAELDHVKAINEGMMEHINNPFKLREYMRNIKLAKSLVNTMTMFKKWAGTPATNAYNRVAEYAKLISGVGQRNENKKSSNSFYDSIYSYGATTSRW